MSAHKLNRLTALAVQNAAEPGRYADGGGLYLEVTKAGHRRWSLRLTRANRTREFGLGPLHKVTLKQAREAADVYRRKFYQGEDPVAEKQRRLERVRKVPSFEDCTREVYKLRRAQFSNGKHVAQWINQLIDYAFPVMRAKPINAVTTEDLLKVLSPIWASKPETARRVRQRLRVILDWARAAGHRQGDNPVDLIGEALPKQKNRKGHFAALPYGEVAEFIAKLRAGHADRMSQLAFEFLILTASRTQEVRFARRVEVERDAKLWTIPGLDTETGRRMKMERDHIVPLSVRAMEILIEAQNLYPAGDLCFPDRGTGKPMSENRFLIIRDALGYAGRCTPHGFRSAFRDWVSEETHFPSEVAEMALAHVVKNQVEAAYRRGKLLAKRRELMDAWATFAISH